MFQFVRSELFPCSCSGFLINISSYFTSISTLGFQSGRVRHAASLLCFSLVRLESSACRDVTGVQVRVDNPDTQTVKCHRAAQCVYEVIGSAVLCRPHSVFIFCFFSFPSQTKSQLAFGGGGRNGLRDSDTDCVRP